jgi:MYXO-CTERM domain-containing protein
MHLRHPAGLALGAAAALVLTAAPARAQLPPGYDHEIRGRTISVPSPLPGFHFPSQTSISGRNVALNDRGDLAITVVATPKQEDTHQAIWAHRDGTGRLVYTGTVSPAFEAGFGDVSLTAAGRLYWTESPQSGAPGVFYLDPGGDRTLITRGPLGTTGFTSLRASEPDRLAALATLGAGRVLIGIEGIQSPSITVYLAEARVDDTSPFTELISGIGLNGTPELTIEAWPAGLEALQRVTGPNQTTQIIAVRETVAGIVLRGIANGAAINSAGQVAFAVFGENSIEAVLRSEPDGSITVIASTAAGSAVAELGNFAPVINDAGLVAFRGVGADGEDAIFAGDGTGLVTVVRETDVVPTDLGAAQIGNETAGQQNTAFSGNIAINQRGDVAYVASVYPDGNRSIEWGSGVFVAVARQPPAPPDAGVPDAGPVDAGIPDASPADAAIPDAALADAAILDAAAPDALPAADATPAEPADAAPGRDAAAPDAAPDDPGTPGDGCGCTAGPDSGSTGLGTLALALGVALLLARSGRPRRSPARI